MGPHFSVGSKDHQLKSVDPWLMASRPSVIRLSLATVVVRPGGVQLGQDFLGFGLAEPKVRGTGS